MTALCERFGVPLVRLPLRRREVSTGQELRPSWFGKLAWDLTRLATFGPLERMLAAHVAADPLSDPTPAAWAPLARPFAFTGGQLPGIARDFCSNMLFIYGYGTAHDVASWYALEFWRLWLTPMATGDLWMVRDGYQSLWQTVADQAGLQVECRAAVTSLTPDADGVVATIAADDRRFDFVVNTVPARVADPATAALFQDVVHVPYWVGVGALPGRDVVAEVSFVNHPGRVNLTAAQAAIRAGRDPDPAGEPTSFFAAPAYHADGRPPAARLQAQALASLASDYGVTGPVEVTHRALWDYFPRFPEAALRDGAPARVWAAQGRDRIWNAGAACCMESVPSVLDYNRRLLEAAGL